jgi:hypothetical protein
MATLGGSKDAALAVRRSCSWPCVEGEHAAAGAAPGARCSCGCRRVVMRAATCAAAGPRTGELGLESETSTSHPYSCTVPRDCP